MRVIDVRVGMLDSTPGFCRESWLISCMDNGRGGQSGGGEH